MAGEERRVKGRRCWVLGALGLGVLVMGCRPGLGAQLPAGDFAHAFTRRDAQTVRTLSTESFRRAVWDRLEPEEFKPIATMMGHGRHMDVEDTQFEDERAWIQMQTEDRHRFRLHVLRVGDEWYVDDVLAEVEPEVYVSKRRQVEGVLAVRDFRRALESGDPSALAAASSRGFASETWQKMTPEKVASLHKPLAKIHEETGGALGELQRARDGSWAASMRANGRGYTFYFAKEGDALVVDDVGLPGGAPSMRARLRKRASER